MQERPHTLASGTDDARASDQKLSILENDSPWMSIQSHGFEQNVPLTGFDGRAFYIPLILLTTTVAARSRTCLPFHDNHCDYLVDDPCELVQAA